MRKGTTPTLTFRLPIEVKMLSNAKITLCQGTTKLEKKLCDCETTEDTIAFKLTQEETFRFDCNSILKVQLRVVTDEGDALASNIFSIKLAECLDDEVLK